MKKIIPGALIFVFFLITQTHAQNIFYDALRLRELKGENIFFPLNDSTNKKVVTILRNYLPDSVRKDTGVGQILNYYKKNNRFIESMIDPAFRQGAASLGLSGALGSLIPKAGSLDVTNLADGLAKFLVERAKEELSLAFFEKLKSDMEKPEFAELRILFPQTHATLQLIDQRIYQYAAYLTELREAFIVDLKDLGYNVPVLLRSPGKIGDYFKTHPDFRTAVTLASQVTDLFIHKDTITHVGTLIEKLDPDHFFSSGDLSDLRMNGSVKLMQLVSASFKSGDPTRYWIPVDSMVTFLSDPVSVRLYLGLIYNNAAAIDFGGGKNLKGMLDNLAAHFNDQVAPFSDGIGKFAGVIGSFDDYWKYKKQDKNKDSTALHYYVIYTKAIDAITSGLGLVKVFDPTFDPAFAKFLPATRTLGDVYINAQQKKFSLSILSLVKFIGELKDAGYDNKLLQHLATYGAFIAEVAQAKSSDEVKDIIEKTVLPVGSASIKKNSRFNISLNAYLGGFFGNEYLPDNGIKHWAKTAGITAPIGIAFSKPLGDPKHNWGSISGFVSVIDIGAIASFRFKDSSTAQLPKLTLQNIFAPGLGLIWGIPKVPVSLGYMYQWGPALREITATDAKLNTGDLNRRWFFFLSVDIPLLNIYNKPR